MTAPFEPLEIQLVKSSLATRTDDELAEILERPVEQVRALIDELTGGQAEARTADINKLIDEKQQAINAKRQRAERSSSNQEEKIRARMKKQQEFEERTRRIAQEEDRKRTRALHEQRRTYKTRVIDQSQMKHVRVNRNTYVQVSRDIPDELAIQQYHQNITSKRDFTFNQ